MLRPLLTVFLLVGSSQALAAQHSNTLPQTGYRILPRAAGTALPEFLEGGAIRVAGDTLIWEIKGNLSLASFRTAGDTLRLVEIPRGNPVCGSVTGTYHL